MNNNTWKKIMALEDRDNRHRGVANTLDSYDIQTLLATADFFGAEDRELAQMNFDLGVARYRVFDWLAMGVMSADDCPRIPVTALKVFVYSLLKVGGDVTAFIDDLRISDYELDTEWEGVELEAEGGDQ